MKTNEFTYKVMDLNTAQLEIPRETYQRELSPDRVRRIVKAFDEHIANIVAEEAGTSKNQVSRYIRLTELIPELRDMVDEKKLSFNPAVELSYLKPEEQKNFLEAMDYAQTTPSLSQAQRMKKLSREGVCSLEAMCGVMDETKKEERAAVTIPQDVLQKYFPKSYTPRQMQEVIVKLLDQWQKKRNKVHSR